MPAAEMAVCKAPGLREIGAVERVDVRRLVAGEAGGRYSSLGRAPSAPKSRASVGPVERVVDGATKPRVVLEQRTLGVQREVRDGRLLHDEQVAAGRR